MDGLERAYALVDEFYLRIREINKEWEDAKILNGELTVKPPLKIPRL